ncbi:alcohol dehydrogenase catalytic domain-containing protein [Rhodococcus sp. NPDC057297]|uniref:alcohol dehydrogenase catalytic domain-containing protein n=1 Tax=Rhodococcus sp. NPDC057297 TaxID=3346090 RepID=UPI0036252B6F
MSAARLHKSNDPFQVDQIDIPEPTGSDVLVRVRACGIVPNLKNVLAAADFLPELAFPEYPAIYGLDPAGEIAAVGPDVLEMSPGQRVYVNPGRSCGSCKQCRNSHPQRCKSYGLGGYHGFTPEAARPFRRYPWGGFAEYMIAPASAMVVLPDNVSYEEAARFGYLGTSYGALARAEAGPTTSVLINGATGTLGVGAILLALAMGVPKILAVARNEDTLASLKALAPSRIVTHSNNDGPCTDWAKKETDGDGPDIVIEALGPGSPPEATTHALKSLARGGRLAMIGGGFDALPIEPPWFMVNQISYLGCLWFTTAQGGEIAQMAAAGTLDLSPLTHEAFTLDQVDKAIEAACNRERGGLSNIVITP